MKQNSRAESKRSRPKSIRLRVKLGSGVYLAKVWTRIVAYLDLPQPDRSVSGMNYQQISASVELAVNVVLANPA